MSPLHGTYSGDIHPLALRCNVLIIRQGKQPEETAAIIRSELPFGSRDRVDARDMGPLAILGQDIRFRRVPSHHPSPSLASSPLA